MSNAGKKGINMITISFLIPPDLKIKTPNYKKKLPFLLPNEQGENEKLLKQFNLVNKIPKSGYYLEKTIRLLISYEFL